MNNFRKEPNAIGRFFENDGNELRSYDKKEWERYNADTNMAYCSYLYRYVDNVLLNSSARQADFLALF